jgi:predicted  nucleic acid-binding Zn-ribbon protein
MLAAMSAGRCGWFRLSAFPRRKPADAARHRDAVREKRIDDLLRRLSAFTRTMQQREAMRTRD